MMNTPQKILKYLIWNSLLLVFGVISIEIAFGNWFQSDELKKLRLLRNGSWNYEVSYPGIRKDERKVVFKKDRWGLRGDYGKPRDVDILTVGGSTTEQCFVSEDATWQAVLSNEFRRGGKEVSIANAGVNGRTTFGHQVDFDLWFPQIKGLKPRYVLLYAGVNDMFFDRPNNKYDRAYDKDASLKHQIKHNSAVYYLLRSLFGIYLAKKHDLAYVYIDYNNATWTDKALMSNHHTALEQRLQGYESRLKEIHRKIRAWGAVPIVVTQPRGDFRVVNGKVMGLVTTQPRITKGLTDPAMGELSSKTANGVDYYRMISLFNDISLKLCKESKGICIDLVHELAFENGDFYDHAHSTKRGARKIGKYLYRKLRDKIS